MPITTCTLSANQVGSDSVRIVVTVVYERNREHELGALPWTIAVYEDNYLGDEKLIERSGETGTWDGSNNYTETVTLSHTYKPPLDAWEGGELEFYATVEIANANCNTNTATVPWPPSEDDGDDPDDDGAGDGGGGGDDPPTEPEDDGGGESGDSGGDGGDDDGTEVGDAGSDKPEAQYCDASCRSKDGNCRRRVYYPPCYQHRG